MCAQVAYTTGYGAVMPAYTQPMMSMGQMPHEEVTNQSSDHTDACGDEYIAAVDTDYTAVTMADDYYSSADVFVGTSDAAAAESAVDAYDEELADKLVS